MSNANPSRSGQINQAGDARALLLKVYAGEVLEARDREAAFANKIMVRTIPYGKSAQFPVIGIAAVRPHTPGAEILGQNISHAEKVILVEDPIISDVFIPNVDEMLQHIDVRGPYARAQGQAMAKFDDQNCARTIIVAARNTTPAITGQPSGSYTEDADLATDGTKIFASIFNAGTVFDTRDIPQQGRHAGLLPVQYALLVRSEKPINMDVNPGGNGSLSQGVVYVVNGIPVFKSNNVPTADDRANALLPDARKLDYSKTVGTVFHEGAAGKLQIQDLTTESIYDGRRQGTLLLAKMFAGYGDLRTDAAHELRTAAPSA